MVNKIIDNILCIHMLVSKWFGSGTGSTTEHVDQDDFEELSHGPQDLLVHSRLATVAMNPYKGGFAWLIGIVMCCYDRSSHKQLLAVAVFTNMNT